MGAIIGNTPRTPEADSLSSVSGVRFRGSSQDGDERFKATGTSRVTSLQCRGGIAGGGSPASDFVNLPPPQGQRRNLVRIMILIKKSTQLFSSLLCSSHPPGTKRKDWRRDSETMCELRDELREGLREVYAGRGNGGGRSKREREDTSLRAGMLSNPAGRQGNSITLLHHPSGSVSATMRSRSNG